MNGILVSVCCLSYNHAEYIAQALDSMLAQKTDFAFEILIHDDASTDGTADIIRSYAEKYPDIIRPLYETENQFSKSAVKNISALYNFPRARGKYIAMCETDDYWTDPDKLRIQAAYLEAHPECSICFHSAAQVRGNVLVADRLVRPYDSDRVVSPEEIIDKKCGYPTASLMVRTEIMLKLPAFYMECPIGDIPMQLLMASAGNGYYFDRPMSAYRYCIPGSWTHEMFRDTPEETVRKQNRYAEQMAAMYDSFDEYTERRFRGAVQSAKDRMYFRTRVNIRDFGTIYDRKYRKYYRELPRKDRIYLWLQKTLKTK